MSTFEPLDLRITVRAGIGEASLLTGRAILDDPQPCADMLRRLVDRAELDALDRVTPAPEPGSEYRWPPEMGPIYVHEGNEYVLRLACGCTGYYSTPDGVLQRQDTCLAHAVAP